MRSLCRPLQPLCPKQELTLHSNYSLLTTSLLALCLSLPLSQSISLSLSCFLSFSCSLSLSLFLWCPLPLLPLLSLSVSLSLSLPVCVSLSVLWGSVVSSHQNLPLTWTCNEKKTKNKQTVAYIYLWRKQKCLWSHMCNYRSSSARHITKQGQT